jgi:hypothetical protein
MMSPVAKVTSCTVAILALAALAVAPTAGAAGPLDGTPVALSLGSGAAHNLRPDVPGGGVIRAALQPRVAFAEPSCLDGLIYDDGGAESGFRLVTQGGGSAAADVVMRFDVGEIGERLDQVCICWNAVNGGASTLDHQLIFYAPNGAGGGPGTELAVVDAEATGIPPFLQTVFLDYDISSLGIETSSNSIYVGVSWNGGSQTGPGHVLCTDENGGGNQPMFASSAGANQWTSLDDLFGGGGATPPDAVLVRVSPQEDVTVPETCPAVPCVESDTVTCLQDERFAVEVDWRTVQQGVETSGSGTPGDLTLTDTDYFWFFNPNNVEMVIKVLDACSFTDRFWVFAGGLTNVEVEMRVCDTVTGIQKTYFNPIETPFQPIQDTQAFATCP